MMKKLWKVYFTSWNYDLKDAIIGGAEYVTNSEEKAWEWVEIHDCELGEEEAYEVVCSEE